MLILAWLLPLDVVVLSLVSVDVVCPAYVPGDVVLVSYLSTVPVLVPGRAAFGWRSACALPCLSYSVMMNSARVRVANSNIIHGLKNATSCRSEAIQQRGGDEEMKKGVEMREDVLRSS
jgi:hypothetical protein